MDRKKNGYAAMLQIFAPAEMDRALAALESCQRPRTRAGVRHVLTVPEMREVANARALNELASSFIGEGATPFRATLFDKSPTSNWLVAWHSAGGAFRALFSAI